MTPYDLNDGDKFKIGEYTSIIVKIEIGGESLLQRNPRRRAATVGKDGETDAVGVVAENRSRRVGANMSLASVSENSELRLEMGGESGNAVEVAAENRNRPGRARRARVLKNEPLQKLCEVETAEEMDNAGPIELKQGRQVRSRRTRVSKKAENVNCDSKLQKPESSGLDANDCRKPESSAWPDVIIDKRTQGGTRRKINLQNEPSESVENEVLKGHEVVEGFNLGLKGSKEEESLSGGKQNIPNGPLEVVQVDVLGEEGVEEINLRQEGYEKLVSTSGVKDSGVEVGDELDLEKMMLGEWRRILRSTVGYMDLTPLAWGLTRSVHPENIHGNVEFPGVDVFICTADPKKEPVVEVMNTVLSAMALDYPTEKLAVYLSDDGGSPLTLYAIKEAGSFARSWLPFCRKYGIKTRCPEAYFSSFGDDESLPWNDEFKADEKKIKSTYESFKKNVEKARSSGTEDGVVHDRPPCVEVILDNRKEGENKDEQSKMPLLVYLSREKRPSHPHRFKAGALNALLRVSGIMSNGPYLLVLDCDMYCNDPTSAKQAMCFHLDPQISGSLSYVQFPQIFYNVSQNDIYDGQARWAYKTMWQGMDGLRGPGLTGTGYYLKKTTLYGSFNQEDEFLLELEKNFGFSRKFNASLTGSGKRDTNGNGVISDEILEEARDLATCAFEKNTKWGKEIGFSYDCLLESTFGGYLLQCKGWKSVYLYPKRPCFLGCTNVDMKDTMVQIMKWASGSLQIGFSRFNPLTYGLSRMSLLQSMCFGFFAFWPLNSIALVIYGTVTQLCLLNGIPLYPKVSNPWFAVFALLYASSHCEHLYDVLSTGGTIRTWLNEMRISLINSVTAVLFGCLEFPMKWIGIIKANFRLTNKSFDKEKLEKYEKGKFDFQGAGMFMVPLRTLVILNVVCLIGGLRRVIIERNSGEMFGQFYLSCTVVFLSYPILQELIPRKGK
ncbi:hypothetical protein F0562_035396 [Nyssa sinensis]|uniref:Glycosyltransferase 2-like domain-containing protein n=1 Tax=Nyssa sinensis TaxID=561372 RepID=A0A5J5A9L0_9ASTE|nr:hypothetical protein F0562_035396 [Nyssa sinensis]